MRKESWWNPAVGDLFENQGQCTGAPSSVWTWPYKDLYEKPNKKLKKIITWKESQLKSLNLLPSWIAFFLCGYFPDPTRFEPFHNFMVIIKSQGWRLNSHVSPVLVKYSWIKYSHSHNSTSESILTEIELSFQPTINAIAVLRTTSGGEYCNKTAFIRRCFSTKTATASNVDNKLTLTLVHSSSARLNLWWKGSC